MDNKPKIGDSFLHLGDEDLCLSPIECVLTYINGDIGVLKVTSMNADYEDFTARYEDVIELFPDFSDPENLVWSHYLFLDMNTLSIADAPCYLNYEDYYDEEYELETNDGEKLNTKALPDEETHVADANLPSDSGANPDDLPF